MASADDLAAAENCGKKVAEMMDELDRSRLRKIQLKMLKCAASCCENQVASIEQKDRCIENCSSGVDTAQRYVQREMQKFFDRLHPCMENYDAKARGRVGPNSSVEEIGGAAASFEVCSTRCMDNQTKLLPELLQRMKKELDTSPANTQVHHVI